MRKYVIVFVFLTLAYGSIVQKAFQLANTGNNNVELTHEPISPQVKKLIDNPEMVEKDGDEAAKITNLNFMKNMLAKKYN